MNETNQTTTQQSEAATELPSSQSPSSNTIVMSADTEIQAEILEKVNAIYELGLTHEESEAVVLQKIDSMIELQTYEAGFSLFFVVVILCVFSYKFLRIFF